MIGRFPLNINNPINYLSGFTNPLGIAYDTINNRIAVVNYNASSASSISIRDATNLSLITTISSPIASSVIKFDATGSRYLLGADAYGSLERGLYTLDCTSYTITRVINTTGKAVLRGIEIDYPNDKLYVSYFGDVVFSIAAAVVIYKLSDFSYISEFAVSKSCGTALDLAAGKLYVACHSDGVVRVYDATTYTLLNTITGVTLAYGIVQDPANSDYMIVQDYSGNRLCLLKKSTNTIIGYYEGVNTPRFSIFLNGNIYTTQAAINNVGVTERFYL